MLKDRRRCRCVAIEPVVWETAGASVSDKLLIREPSTTPVMAGTAKISTPAAESHRDKLAIGSDRRRFRARTASLDCGARPLGAPTTAFAPMPIAKCPLRFNADGTCAAF
jgi:hypothetical protein